MNPVILTLLPDYSNLTELAKKVSSLLKENKVGAIPTETFYGLACNPFSQKAVERLFYLKKRPPNKPIILLIGDIKQLFLVVEEIPPLGQILIKAFWPGPLTIVFKAKKEVLSLLTANTGTIGVRFSSSIIVREICKTFKLPITGTSANISETQPSRNIKEILKELPEIDFVLDGGELKAQAPSTVISVVDNKLSLIREGMIPFNEIKKKVFEDSFL